MLKIGDFSKLTRISIRMLRHYEKIGLLKPNEVDDFTGYRYYSVEQLTEANRITSLRELGFGLADTAKILKEYNNPEALSRFLEVKYEEVKTQKEDIGRRLMLIETTIERLRKDGKSMEYNVTVKTFPERYVASVRRVIPSYNCEGDLWEILRRETMDMNLQIDDPCYSMAVFHDEGYKESDVDVEIQMSVKGKYKDTENVKFKSVPPVEAATVIYKGSYDNITEANGALANWVNDNGYDFSGTMFSIYHVSPAQTRNPEDYVTEVCCPIRSIK